MTRNHQIIWTSGEIPSRVIAPLASFFCGDKMKSFTDRFWSKVEKGPSCWEWTASMCNGYGYFRLDGRKERSHRVSWELKNGKIPEGLVIDHLCRNTSCVNPDHMEVVTQIENIKRGIGFSAINRRKTECIHGHEFTKENTYIRPPYNWRSCKKCQKATNLRTRNRNRTKL